MIQFTYKLKLNEASGQSAVATPAKTRRRTTLVDGLREHN
jgi:hypothetical protein